MIYNICRNKEIYDVDKLTHENIISIANAVLYSKKYIDSSDKLFCETCELFIKNLNFEQTIKDFYKIITSPKYELEITETVDSNYFYSIGEKFYGKIIGRIKDIHHYNNKETNIIIGNEKPYCEIKVTSEKREEILNVIKSVFINCKNSIENKNKVKTEIEVVKDKSWIHNFRKHKTK